MTTQGVVQYWLPRWAASIVWAAEAACEGGPVAIECGAGRVGFSVDEERPGFQQHAGFLLKPIHRGAAVARWAANLNG